MSRPFCLMAALSAVKDDKQTMTPEAATQMASAEADSFLQTGLLRGPEGPHYPFDYSTCTFSL